LARYDLHYTDRGEHLRRRKEIYEKKYPETKAGNVRATGMNKKLGYDVEEIISPTFTADTASKLNITERTVRQEIQIAERLTPDVKMPVTGIRGTCAETEDAT